MTIAEDLVLLLVDPRTGRLTRDRALRDDLVAGALLADLAQADRVGLSMPEDGGRSGRVIVLDPTPTGDELLDEALAALHTQQWRKPHEVVPVIARSRPSAAVLARLVDRGVLQAEQGTTWGIVPTALWATVDPVPRAAVVRLLCETVAREEEPGARARALVSLLAAARLLGQVVDVEDVLQAERRARALGVGHWPAEAVRAHRASGAVAVG